VTKAIRIYYTCFDDGKNRKILEKIEEITGIRPIVHQSFIEEFKYIEVINTDEKYVDAIRKALTAFLGELSKYRIDYISV
jgi:hypothetical protein